MSTETTPAERVDENITQAKDFATLSDPCLDRVPDMAWVEEILEKVWHADIEINSTSGNKMVRHGTVGQVKSAGNRGGWL